MPSTDYRCILLAFLGFLLLFSLFVHSSFFHPANQSTQQSSFFTTNIKSSKSGHRHLKSRLRNDCLHPVTPFPCKNYDDSDGIASDNRDAMHVRFSDIGVIATLGDSISAGFGMVSARAPFTRLFEYRGKVFNIGGDKGEYTLPNYLRIYNPALVGAPTSVSAPLALGKALDMAVSGSIAQDLPVQAKRLLWLFKLPQYKPKLKHHNWKLINIFIGANNLCRVCHSTKNVSDPEWFEQSLRDTLNILRDGTDRVLINLIGIFNITKVYEIALYDKYCRRVFERFHFCPCIVNGESTRREMDTLAGQYNQIMQKLVWEWTGLKRFKVNFQPGLINVDIAQYGREYLSNFDCFHPNLCANRAMSLGLWANMVQLDGSKSIRFDPHNLTWVCPTRDNMYIH